MDKEIVLFSEERLQYYIVAMIGEKIRMILIDTGACFNHIHRSIASQLIKLEEHITTYSVFGTEIHQFKSLETIVFETKLVKEIEFLVEETENRNDPMYKTVIIGMNTLDQLDFVLTKTDLILQNIRIPRIRIHMSEHQEIENRWN